MTQPLLHFTNQMLQLKQIFAVISELLKQHRRSSAAAKLAIAFFTSGGGLAGNRESSVASVTISSRVGRERTKRAFAILKLHVSGVVHSVPGRHMSLRFAPDCLLCWFDC